MALGKIRLFIGETLVREVENDLPEDAEVDIARDGQTLDIRIRTVPPEADLYEAEAQLYKAADGWRFRIVASNGRILGDSGEAYTRKAAARKAAGKLAATVVEVEA